jgi:thermopsin
MSKKLLSILVIIVALVMVISTVAVISPGDNHSSSSNTATTSASLGNLAPVSTQTHLSQKSVNVLNKLHSQGVPNKYIYLPNFNPQVNYPGNATNGPSYLQAPAPMGIGTYGFSNTSGVIHRNTINTSSVAASVTMNNLSTFYALDDGPNSVTMQLNAIMHNVTLFGNSSYTFWTQNVLFYSARTHTLLFLDNIWNFSSEATNMTPNALSSYNGTIVPYTYYYTVGPQFQITYPFTVNLYLNTSVVNGNDAVFFNFSLADANGSVSGSYDQVQFNSTYGTSPGYSAPLSNLLITSNYTTPIGIPYDAEIMIGGPGGGSTAMIYQINASMTLKYLDSTGTYANVPNAFDVGSETGETSTGIAVTWSQNAVAHLTAGPSFVYGMWNDSSVQTFQHYQGKVNPPNSFAFVAGTITPYAAELPVIVPLNASGAYSFSLPTATYAMYIMMSNYNPISTLMDPGQYQQFNLQVNMTQGVYTPLYAFGNSQLKYISYAGDGSYQNPYMLFNNPSPNGQLNTLFSTMNDYLFPQFSGVLLHSTTAHVVANGMPSFNVPFYQVADEQFLFSELYGINSYYTNNDLGYVLYNTQNAVITNSQISGWFPFFLTGFPVANVLLWNSQNNAVINNYFNTLDSSLLIYNMQGQFGHNYVANNLFLQNQSLNLSLYQSMFVSPTLSGNTVGPVGMSLFSSGNTITGNTVIVYNTAISPNQSIYSGAPAKYLNNWNGNFWWNYQPMQNHGRDHFGFNHFWHGHHGNRGNPVYNDNGLIAYGGDHSPISYPGYNPAYLEPYVTNFFN